MKLIIPQGFFGPIYIDDGTLGLGPTDFMLIGPRHVGGMIDGRWGMVERELAPRKFAGRPRKQETVKR